jgi:hypothetical protein
VINTLEHAREPWGTLQAFVVVVFSNVLSCLCIFNKCTKQHYTLKGVSFSKEKKKNKTNKTLDIVGRHPV